MTNYNNERISVLIEDCNVRNYDSWAIPYLVDLKKARELLQEFVDISHFDVTDPERARIPTLKQEAKKLLGGQ